MRHLGALRVAAEPLAEFRREVDLPLRVVRGRALAPCVGVVLDHGRRHAIAPRQGSEIGLGNRLGGYAHTCIHPAGGERGVLIAHRLVAREEVEEKVLVAHLA